MPLGGGDGPKLPLRYFLTRSGVADRPITSNNAPVKTCPCLAGPPAAGVDGHYAAATGDVDLAHFAGYRAARVLLCVVVGCRWTGYGRPVG